MAKQSNETQFKFISQTFFSSWNQIATHVDEQFSSRSKPNSGIYICKQAQTSETMLYYKTVNENRDGKCKTNFKICGAFSSILHLLANMGGPNIVAGHLLFLDDDFIKFLWKINHLH